MSSSELLDLQLEQSDEELQAQRFRFVLFSMAGSGAHTLICLFYLFNGYYRGDMASFLSLFSAIWGVNLVLIYLVKSGHNMRFRHPDLLVPQLFISATGILASAYYVEVFRLSVMMLFFGIMLLGASRVKLATFLTVSTYASIGYGYVLFQVITDFPTEVTVSVEVLEWISFTMMATAFAITGTRIAALQKDLTGKNQELNSAFEQLKAMARQDELTGLNNRRYVMELLEKQKSLVTADDYCFTICYADLDHFKQINDTFGHAAGDEVLKAFSKSVQGEIRNVDIAGRLGGEEFIVILSGANVESSKIVLERIRKKIEELDFSDVAEGLSVTVSLGLTAYRAGEEISDTLARADELLYKAKTNGRNQLCTEGE